jgi:hypothetical protein
MTLDEFAVANDLKMVVHEREFPSSIHATYYAKFEECDIVEGSFLKGAFGNGATPYAAMADYCNEISQKTIKIDSYGTNPRVIYVPILTGVE